MNIIIDHEKILLRELTPADAEDFFRLNANPEVMKYTGDQAFTEVIEALYFLENYDDYKRNGYGRWAVVEKSGHHFLGWCGIKLHADGLIDLGYRFFQHQWGKGWASLSSMLVLEYAFGSLGIEYIMARAHPENLASIRVMEKIGMSFWKQEEVEGLGHAIHYHIRREEWLQQKKAE